MAGEVVVTDDAFRMRVSCVPGAPHGQANQAFPQVRALRHPLLRHLSKRGNTAPDLHKRGAPAQFSPGFPRGSGGPRVGALPRLDAGRHW